ncbi:MAG: hypothetical protein MSC30_03565 [Gaiellaceae bacterium MAG52_C11]|nr:hypothetical protein [Candidatus Gaiellasilicea maunaloa]
MAVAEVSDGERSYRTATSEDATKANIKRPDDAPDLPIPDQALGFRVQLYGMSEYADLFTNRQILALSSFADAVASVPRLVLSDGGDREYAGVIASVLGLGVGSSHNRIQLKHAGTSIRETALLRLCPRLGVMCSP